MCACLPILRPIFAKFIPSPFSQDSGKKRYSSNAYRIDSDPEVSKLSGHKSHDTAHSKDHIYDGKIGHTETMAGDGGDLEAAGDLPPKSIYVKRDFELS